jgi:hypothetical protein
MALLAEASGPLFFCVLFCSFFYIYFIGMIILCDLIFLFVGIVSVEIDKALGRHPRLLYFCLTSYSLTVQCFLTFWKYHVLNGSGSTDKAAAAAYPPITRMVAASLGSYLSLKGRAASILQDTLGALEGGIDLLGVIAMGLGVFVTKEYVMEVREQRREAAAKGVEAAASGKKDE